MFALVNDIEAYPQYMDGCVTAEVLSASQGELVARLGLQRLKMSQSFVTRNQLQPPTRMTMELEEGPFKYLHGCWTFKALSETACKVSFELTFELSNRVAGKMAGKLLESVANDLVDGLCRRARQLYVNSAAQ